MAEFNYATRRGIRYVISSNDSCVVTAVDEIGKPRILLSTYGGEQDDFVSISDMTTVTSDSEPSFTPVLHDFSVPSSGNEGESPDAVPNHVLKHRMQLMPESIIIPNGKILLLEGLDDLEYAFMDGLQVESLGDDVYSTGELYIPAMSSPPIFNWSLGLRWIKGDKIDGTAPAIEANTTYRFALRREGINTYINLTYSNTES